MAIVNAIFSSRWARSEYIVAPSQTLDIDSNLLSEFKGTKYYIQSYSDTNSVYKTIEMLVTKEGSGVSDSVFGRIGDNIDLDFVFGVIGSNAVLSATNNESFPVSIILTKLN